MNNDILNKNIKDNYIEVTTKYNVKGFLTDLSDVVINILNNNKVYNTELFFNSYLVDITEDKGALCINVKDKYSDYDKLVIPINVDFDHINSDYFYHIVSKDCCMNISIQDKTMRKAVTFVCCAVDNNIYEYKLLKKYKDSAEDRE